MNEPAQLSAARAAMTAVRAAEQARQAMHDALAVANRVGVALPGWLDLQAAIRACDVVTNPHGHLRALAENEIRTAGEQP